MTVQIIVVAAAGIALGVLVGVAQGFVIQELRHEIRHLQLCLRIENASGGRVQTVLDTWDRIEEAGLETLAAIRERGQQ